MFKRVSAAVDRASDSLIDWLSFRVNDATGCFVPVCLAFVLVLLVPVVTRRMPMWYFLLSFAAFGALLVLSLAWVTQVVRAGARAHLLDWTSDLRSLNGREFEDLVAAMYEREGFEVRMRGGYRRDGGVDVELIKDGRPFLVQCKCWGRDAVPESVVNRLAAALTKEHLPASQGVIVAMKDFLPEAVVAAKSFGIQLVDGAHLRARLAAVRRTEPCTVCGRPMLLAKSVFGWWLRCPAAGCRGKRDLGDNADRVVRLLLEQGQRRTV